MQSTRLRVVRMVPGLDYGGVESRVALQAESIDRTRFDFRVCAFERPGAAKRRIENSGIRVDMLDCAPSIRNPRTTYRVFRYLRALRPDVLHSSVGNANFHGMAAGWLAGIPNRIAEEVGLSEPHPLTVRMLRFAYRRAHTVIGVSQTVCEHVRGLLRLHPARIRCVYNPVPPAFFKPIKRVRREADKPVRLLAVGRLVSEKNHLFLLDVLEELDRIGCKAQLRIAGEGPIRPLLEEQIATRGLEHRVQLLGYRSDVPDLLARADVFVLPSTKEGHANAVLEAMAFGIPVIVSAIPSNLEIFRESAIPLTSEQWAERCAELLTKKRDEFDRKCDNVQTAESYAAELATIYDVRY